MGHMKATKKKTDVTCHIEFMWLDGSICSHVRVLQALLVTPPETFIVFQ